MQPNTEISIITCTGERPEAFGLCCEYLRRQQGLDFTVVEWIVIDDGKTPQKNPRMPFRVKYVRPKPCWTPGANTLAHNLLEAIPLVTGSKIILLEDDDHYTDDYVASMSALLDRAMIAGQSETHYYHVRTRRYRTFIHHERSSLCATGFRRAVLPTFRSVCMTGLNMIDVRFWHQLPSSMHGFIDGVKCVGIKGMPGRPGIGIGHIPRHDWPCDQDGQVLRRWLGKDSELYGKFSSGN